MPKETENEITAYKLKSQKKTLEQIGVHLGVSRERARQLIFSYKMKKKQGVFSELRTRSLSVLINLNIKDLGELRARFPEFKNPPNSYLKYKYRGCGDLVYEDLKGFLARHVNKPNKTSRYN